LLKWEVNVSTSGYPDHDDDILAEATQCVRRLCMWLSKPSRHNSRNPYKITRVLNWTGLWKEQDPTGINIIICS